MRTVIPVVLTVALLLPPAAIAEQTTPSAQQTPAAARRGSKAKWIGLAIGAGAGFALGSYAGLAWFDDAIDSDRKVFSTAIAFAAGGAIGGFLLGKTFSDRSDTAWAARRPRGEPAPDWKTTEVVLPRLHAPPPAAPFGRLASMDALFEIGDQGFAATEQNVRPGARQ